ncbi:hypothetical protein Cgig2_014650 [Carnegiea gigantea]|uniref:Inositol-tetrakisphosphate 1-kinase n=1 Tax=Carnegiea gigantea TaxID=171969 RepID=A0A9Q1KZW0_9CARY|nr:hypothetical protein Cgig2_014650 [Carnegiea gigantea]
MRLDGEITEIDDVKEAEIEKEVNSISNSDSLSITLGFAQQVVVGYALTAKKKESFLQPKFELIARTKGIVFVPIDHTRPLSDQGPFDVILHKVGQPLPFAIQLHIPALGFLLILHLEEGIGGHLTFLETRQSAYVDDLKEAKGKIAAAMFISLLCHGSTVFILLLILCSFQLMGNEWSRLLEDYRLKHPDVTVLDPPYAIKCVHNRQSMLEDVAALNLANCHGRVCVPTQLVVKNDASSISSEVAKAGLKLPLVAKPLFVDGSAKSHQLFLAYDKVSLSKLEPPLVLQEFVNHGGVMFKVYVVGDAIKVVRRFSLPDVCKRELSKHAGVFQFPRVSGAAASADEADLDPGVAELPPRPLLERLVGELRNRMESSLNHEWPHPGYGASFISTPDLGGANLQFLEGTLVIEFKYP